MLEPSDFQKWSVLAFRALDDAGRVLMTIEPESTHEVLLLDQLKETIRELLTQALVLNGVMTRRQMDKQFQFGKLDIDSLLIAQSDQQQAELKLSSEEIQQVLAAASVPEGLQTPEMEDCLQKYRDRVTGTVKIQEWEDAKTASMVPVIPAESITDAMMNLVDRLGSESKQVDLRAWQHLLVYAPQQQAEPVAHKRMNDEAG